MDKTTGARRRQLLAAVSLLGVSLGMAESALAANDDPTTTQSSQKSQSSSKSWSQSSVKGQSSVKTQTGQHSTKTGQSPDQNSAKTQGGPPVIRYDLNQQKSN